MNPLLFGTGPLLHCRRIIWNFFRLENEHLNNCGNFRAVRDIGIAPIPKETPPPPVNQEGDKAYGMFNQLLTLTRNNKNGFNNNRTNGNSNSNSLGTLHSRDEINQSSSDAEGSDDGGGNEETAEKTILPATLAEYAAILHQNNRKSLWNHLRATYFQTKKERRRKVEFDRILGMEEALRAAKRDVQVSSLFNE